MIMKHLKLFESFEDIDSICKKYNIVNYTINDDGTVDVDGSVNLNTKGLTKLPLRFGRVTGNFDCYNNKLTTLDGCPDHVGGDFDCSRNQLTTLEGAPKEVNGDFYCSNNQLTTLEGAPSYVGGDFECRYNKLNTLNGGPSYVGRGFDCNNNQLTTLEGSPKEVGNFNCSNNPIHSIYKLFTDHKAFMDSLDYNYLRGTDIVKTRFEEACEEAGIRMPEKIEGYNYI